MSRTHQLYPAASRPRIALPGAASLTLAMLAVMLVLAFPHPAAAAAVPTSYPKLAHWWAGADSLADDARRDYYVPSDDDPLHPDTARIASLRRLNPDIILLASASAAELDFSPTNDRAYDSQRMAAIPNSWLLLQVGSTLSAPVTASASAIPVADTSKFRVDDLVVIDDERCLVTGVAGSLTVKRGFAGSSAAAHGSGARVAAVVSGWPGAATLDMTAACPPGRATGTFATPGTGSEHASDWLARRTAGAFAAADWDGVLIDVCYGGYANGYVGSDACRTIAQRTAPGAEADYPAFDLAWQSGIETFLSSVRTLVGEKALIVTNDAPPIAATVNGSTFEGFPTPATTPLRWYETVVGRPRHVYEGSYLDWGALAKAPDLSTVMTFGGQTDYQLMRFGLCTSLMGDGYFAYESATNGHSVTGRWYDEYDNAGAGKGYLGKPLAPMSSALPALSSPDLLSGYGAFSSQAALGAWSPYAKANYALVATLDAGAAKIQVTRSAGAIGGVALSRPGVSLASGKTYTLSFRARADRSLMIQALVQKASSPYTTYLATDEIPLNTEWKTFEVPLTSSGTDAAAELGVLLGKSVGSVWLDDVKIQQGERDVYRRDYENGIALVNPTNAAVTVDLNGTFRKIKGKQAPLVNDGSLVSAVTLPPHDGLVLLRPVAVPVPDTTPPVTTVSGLAGGWSKSDVTFALTATDAGSPEDISTFYGLNTAALVPYIGPVTLTNPGTTTVSYYSVDASGNAGAVQSAVVRIDKTPPAITAAPSAPPAPSGWYRGPVTIDFSASDALSGLAAVSPDVVIAAQGSGQGATGSATDVAGNTANAAVSGIRIDSVAPVTTDDHVAFYTATATVRLTAADAVSGPGATTWTLDGVGGSGTTVTTSVLGAHTLSYGSTDVAGNVEAVHTISFTVSATDQAPPVTTMSSVPTTWSRTDVSFSLSASDADTPNGIKTYYGIAGPALTLYDGPVTVAAEGTSAITYYSVDALGNTEPVKTAQIRIDKTAPATEDDHIASYAGSATVLLTPTDACSGAGSTTWKLDEAKGSGTTVTTSGLGAHTLTYASTDVAGNAEAVHTVEFTVTARSAKQPIYRFYNKKNGSHFYTASDVEKAQVLANLTATYSYDGIAFTDNLANTANTSPLYRFYNKKNGSHFYTASESEKDYVLDTLSSTYTLDGPAYDVCLTPVDGATTVYRFYNKKNGSHFYTASESERDYVLDTLSNTYTLDGPAFYLAP